MNKNLLLVFISILFSIAIFAQEEVAETPPICPDTAAPMPFIKFKKESPQIYGRLGVSTYQGDVHCRSDGAIGIFDALNPSFGAGVRFPVYKTFGARLQGQYFRLSGDETEFEEKDHLARGWSFVNNFLEVAGLIDWEILGHRRYKDCKFKRTLTPVIFAGIGAAFVNPEVNYNGNIPEKANEDAENAEKVQLAIPIGVGLKYYMTDAFALGFEVGIRRPVSDYYDGVSLVANPEWEDGYGFGGLTAFFRLGKKKDRDADGFYNFCDNCYDDPNKQLPGSCGCGKADFDTDNDNTNDCRDCCPDDPLKTKPGACGCGVADTDSDEDGTPDCIDECPEDPFKIKPGDCGCGKMDTDTDFDGTPDCVDECPEDPKKIAKGNCGCGKEETGDSDGDGVPDCKDDCPTIPGMIDRNGCNPPPPPPTPVCDCQGHENDIYNIPVDKKPRVLTKLGTNPEFGNSHSLDAYGFYNKLRARHNKSRRDRKFLDNLFRELGYNSFLDVGSEKFSEVEIPYGTTGNIGYSKQHKTLYVTLNAKSKRDLQAFKIKGNKGDGCDIHFMKTCGNHMFFCAPATSY